MKRQLLAGALFYACSFSLFAAEHVIKADLFEKKVSMEGVLLPERTVTFRLEPESWSSFPIVEVVEQGAAVAQGAAVVLLDTEDLDRKIAEEKEAARIRKLDLANEKLRLTNLKVQTPRRLEAAQRAHERAKEDLEYFKSTDRPLRKEAAERAVERSERQLEYQQEELNQLLKMYREDDLTEETEEIILKRQRNAVTDAENLVKRSRISAKKVLETDLPRQAEDLLEKFKETKLNLATKNKTLPRALEKKNLEVKKLIEDDQKADERLEELVSDRALMDITAPEKGRIYYGEISKGKWSLGQTAKFLKKGGKLPSKTNFVTLIPEGVGLHLHTAASEAQVQALKAGQKGYFAPISSPRRRLRAELVSVASYPDLSGKYPVVFKIEGEMKGLVPTMKGKVHLVTESLADAITVPAAALIEKGDGSLAVKVKPEEGDPEERVIEVGAESGGRVVVTSGLAAGQVVITKAEKK